MLYTDICNLPWMYIFVGAILLFILGQNFIMMRKAWRHAKEDLGMESAKIRKGLINGILVSIAPTIPILIVLLSLTPLLGTPLPWLRLSVIGSASWESVAATLGVESAGETLALGGYTIAGWIAACWCMNLGGASNLVWSILAVKPVSKVYNMAEKFDGRLMTIIGTGCLAGVMAYVTVTFGAGAPSTNGIIFGASFLLGGILAWYGRKNPKATWVSGSLMPICMIFGMVIACIVF